MTGVEFQTYLGSMFGDAWRRQGAEALGVTVSTIDRWVGGYVEIPKVAIVAVKALRRLDRYKRKLARNKMVQRARRAAEKGETHG